MSSLDDLRALIAKHAVRRGPVTLSAGGTSNVYFDLKRVLLRPEGARLVGRLMSLKVAHYGVSSICGPTYGGAILAALIVAQTWGKVVGSYDQDRGNHLRGVAGRGGVVLVDDVATTGASLFRTMEAVAADRPNGPIRPIVAAIVVVDREEGAREALAAEGVYFDCLFRASEFARECTS